MNRSGIMETEQDDQQLLEKLEESESNLRQIFDSINDAIFVTDIQGRFLEVNKAACQQLGYTKEELLRLGPVEITPPEIGAHIHEKIMDTMEKGHLIFETVHLAKDGSQIPIELSTRMVNYQGTPVILGVARDITERKRAEEALKKSEEKFSKAFHGTLAAKAIVRLRDGMFIDANDRWLKLHEMTRDEAIGHTSIELNVWANPEDRKGFVRELENRGSFHDEEFRFRSKDGRVWIAQMSAQLIEIGGEKVIISSLLDITERKKVEEELKRSNADLQQFAYVASHDLREPLRMISSYLDLLEKKYDGKVLDDKAKEYIDFAVDGAERMRQLIADILSYSRVETKGKEFAEVDMNEVLATVLNDLRKSIEESGATITHDSLPLIIADKSQMVLLLENLIGNAIKFRSEESPRIHISAEWKGREWVFSVRDNGIGIAKIQQDRIFQMFQRLHAREEYEGTGIGLAIAKKIVDRHGGHIWMESEEGKGSTFHFTIPKRP